MRFGAWFLTGSLIFAAWVSSLQAAPLNVILFIGDGMGFEAVEAGRYFANGDTAPFVFETFASTGQMTHNNASNATTDSAASGTAMATGKKVNNGVISVALPGSGSELTTVLEVFKSQGRSTGLVTIDTPITDATPAAFGAHETSRNNTTAIANDYLNHTKPNILFGQSNSTIVSGAPAAGYTLVTNSTDFGALDPEAETFIAGMFPSGDQPTLAAMTTKALNTLDNNPLGFFLLIEHEDTDSGGHANDISRVVNGVIELNAAVQAAINWATAAGALDDTLIVVTADHETGGLNTIANNGAGNLPTVTWSTTGHTQTPVPVYATGPLADASRVNGVIDNTDIFYILTSTVSPEDDPNLVSVTFQQGAGGYTGTVDTFLQENSPTANNAAATALNIDGDDPAGTGRDVQALVRFEQIFGNNPGQIPPGAEIVSAYLELQVTNGGNNIQLHHMLQDWQDTDTWNSLIGGVQANGIEAASILAAATGTVSTGLLSIDVTGSLEAWLADPTSNRGWLFLPTGSDGVDFFSSEGATPPRLVVNLVAAVPEPGTLMLALLGICALLVYASCVSRRRCR